MSFLSFIDEPLGELNFEVKPWHVALGALGVGGVVWYLVTQKGSPSKQAPLLTNQGAAAGRRGAAPRGAVARKQDCVKVGTQTAPLFAGHPIVNKVKAFQKKGWKIFRVSTGQQNVLPNRQRFDVATVWACPPGLRPPPGVQVVKPARTVPPDDGGDESDYADQDSEPIETESAE